MNHLLNVTKLVILITIAVGLYLAPADGTGADWNHNHWAVCATDWPVSIYLRPDGAGKPFDDAYDQFGNPVDATITVYVVDGNYDPIPGYPAEDIVLEWNVGDVVFCAHGNIADGSTDDVGVTTFTASPRGGGFAMAEGAYGLQVLINGMPLWQPAFDISANSPDLTGDLAVNLADVAAFTQIFWSGYDYRADFYRDGVVNLSDIAIFMQALTAGCP